MRAEVGLLLTSIPNYEFGRCIKLISSLLSSTSSIETALLSDSPQLLIGIELEAACRG
jgi:hypothetical protein